MNRRPWTTLEVDLLRELRDRCMLRLDELPRHFPDRSPSSVRNALHRFEIRVRKSPRRIDERMLRVASTMHGMGLGNGEIAECLNCDRETVRLALRKMGLQTNRFTERHRRRIREAQAAWCERNGVDSLAQVNAVEFRKRIAETGWPIECHLRETQILDVLESHDGAEVGMTRRELCQAIGLPWLGSHRSMKCSMPGGNYTASLMRRGLIVRSGHRPGKVRGRSEDLYALAPGVKRKRLALPTREERRIAEMELLRRVAG